MKIENVVAYNKKTKALTLVTGIKDMEKKEVDTKVIQYPFYVEGIYTQKAIELGAEVEIAEYVIDGELFERLINFFVELYGKQFTHEELMKGIHQNNIVAALLTMLTGVLQGEVKNG